MSDLVQSFDYNHIMRIKFYSYQVLKLGPLGYLGLKSARLADFNSKQKKKKKMKHGTSSPA